MKFYGYSEQGSHTYGACATLLFLMVVDIRAGAIRVVFVNKPDAVFTTTEVTPEWVADTIRAIGESAKVAHYELTT